MRFLSDQSNLALNKANQCLSRLSICHICRDGCLYNEHSIPLRPELTLFVPMSVTGSLFYTWQFNPLKVGRAKMVLSNPLSVDTATRGTFDTSRGPKLRGNL